MLRRIPSLMLCSLAVLGGCSSPQPGATTSSSTTTATTEKKLESASVAALPNARCQLHPEGNTADSVPVLVSDDGIARFQAVHATDSDTVQRLTLDCSDRNGKSSSFVVDLRADATFAARPQRALPTAASTGLREALAGDPMSYSQGDLIRAGYGLRPDPTQNPAGYKRWLASAMIPARTLHVDQTAFSRPKTRTGIQPLNTIVSTAPNWTGAVLTGATGLPATPAGSPAYVVTEATFNVPSGIPGGDRTGNTGISIWNGLGGFGTGGGLIQGGIQMFTSTSAASYIMFREYCCGSPVSNNYSPTFTPAPGDTIYSEQWYCDSKGEFSLNGGYGCSFLHDVTQNAYFSCVSPTDTTCASVPALSGWVFGQSADLVIELETGPAFTPFTPTVTMAGTAGVIYGNGNTINLWETIQNDPTVWQLTDFTQPQSSTMQVNLGPGEQVNFSVACVPLTTASCNGACGSQPDGCGGNMNCPACPPPTCHTPRQCCAQDGCIWRLNRCICE